MVRNVAPLAVLVAVGCGKPNIQVAEAGPTEFVAAGPSIHAVGDGAPDRFNGFSSFIEGPGQPAHLYVLLKKGERIWHYPDRDEAGHVYADARIEPDGAWSRLEMQQAYRLDNAASVEIPREYPDGAVIRVRVHTPSGDSEALLRNLPSTKPMIELVGPVRDRIEPEPGVRIEAVAYRPKVKRAGDAPIAGILIRGAFPKTPNVLWRLDNLGVQPAYGPPGVTSTITSRILRSDLSEGHPLYMEEQSGIFIDSGPRIGIQGQLQRCEYHDETVELGTLPIERRGARTYVTVSKPVKRTLSDGSVLTVLPIDPKSRYKGEEAWTTLRLALEGPPPAPGEDKALKVGFLDKADSHSDFDPLGGSSEVNVYAAPPKGPLRLRLRRTRVVQSYPIDFNPDLHPVGFTAMQSGRFGRSGYMGIADANRLALFGKSP